MFFRLIGGKIWHEFRELARIEFVAAAWAKQSGQLGHEILAWAA
jgi:hypothetical protein